jgi:AGZA family xanthine/uracil permease-like MFS transporter
VLGWAAAAFGWSDYMKGDGVSKAFATFGLHLPWFSLDVLTGLANIGPLLATAIPLGIYNFTEAMNNVESASAAGDNYNLRKILLADGVGAIVGSLLGSPFPPAVYIGHPGWKSVGGRIGYSLATGVCIALVCFLGLTALLLNVIPLVAILPILLFIGLVIGAQAFQASPSSHAPAVVLAIIPNIAEWARINIDSALQVAGSGADKVGLAALGQVGVVYQGMALLGSGSVLAGMVLGSMAAFIIDRKLTHAAAAAFIGAALAFIGLIHGPHLCWMVSPLVALGYAMFGAICLLLSRQLPPGSAAAS